MKIILFALLLTLAVQGQNKQNTQKTVSKTSTSTNKNANNNTNKNANNNTNKNANNNTNKNANNNTNKNDNKNTNPSTNTNDSKSKLTNADSSAPKKLTGQQALDNVKKERFQLKQAQEKYNQASQQTEAGSHITKAVAKTLLEQAKEEYNGAVKDFRNT